MHLVFSSQNTRICIFIGPRCPWGPIYGSSSLKLSPRPYADLTLADENTNSILNDSANRAFQGNVAMQGAPSGGQIWNALLALSVSIVFVSSSARVTSV